MNILFIGKFPPIQGGVAAQGFALVEHLCGAGHDVHVLSDGMTVEPDYRIYLTGADFVALKMNDLSYRNKVNTTFVLPFFDDVKKIPVGGMTDTMLFGHAVRLCQHSAFDLVISNYLYPYGCVAGAISSRFRIPHVMYHAGSDLFDLFMSDGLKEAGFLTMCEARYVVTNSPGLLLLKQYLPSVDQCATNIRAEIHLPQTPLTLRTVFDEYMEEVAGSSLLNRVSVKGEMDRARSAELRLGVCGKIGATKGSFHIVDAVNFLVRSGKSVCCIAAWANTRKSRIREYISHKGLDEHFVLIPPLPRWRMPAFYEYCDAIMHLENGFWLESHTPMVPLELSLLGHAGIFSHSISSRMRAFLPADSRASWLEIPEPIHPIEVAERIRSADFRELKNVAASQREKAEVTLAQLQYRSLSDLISTGFEVRS